MDTIGELTAMADQGGRKREFILAVPARRYGALAETFRGLAFSEEGLAEAAFAGHRLIVAHDPTRAALQSAKRRGRIAELDAMADKLVTRLDAQDADETARGRNGTRPPGVRPGRLQPVHARRGRGRTHAIHQGRLHR